jgi:hypothetical protein
MQAPPRSDLARQLAREASAELVRLRRIRGAHRKTARRIARARAQLACAAALMAAALAEPALAGAPRFDNGAFGIANVGSSATPAFADIDGDGDLDAFAGERYGILSFFENTGAAGAPAFAPRGDPFGFGDVGFNSSPAFVDIDGDGDLDAFVGERFGSTLFFENMGTATVPAFAPPAVDPFGLANVGLRAAPAFADLDGDGDLDAFIGEVYGNTLFFQNTGTATAPAFAPPATNPFGLADVGERARPGFGDLDGDGDLDAVFGELNGDTFYFVNTGSAGAPAFAAPQANALGLAPVPYTSAPALVDVDGDGDLDAFVGEFYGASTFFENTGTSAAPAFLATASNPFGPAALTNVPTPTLADLDGDGDLDALVGNASGSTLFFENTGSATAPSLAAPLTDPFGLADVGTYAAPALADLDGDGDLDALVGNGAGNSLFFQNAGTAFAPAFAAPVTNPFGLADVGNRAAPALADLDGDGDLDALLGNTVGSFLFFRNTGSAAAPAFAAPLTNPFGLVGVGGQAVPAVADLDGDGDRDVLAGELGGSTLYFENAGTAAAPAFAAPVLDAAGLSSVATFATPTLADLDGDGDLDASIGGYLGRIFYFENRELDAEACVDGVDNDGDGRIDHPSDAGCASAGDTSERSAKQCDNGSDDDGDGRIDWRSDGSGDPQCLSLGDNTEGPTPAPPGCGMGPELALLVPFLSALRARAARRRLAP